MLAGAWTDTGWPATMEGAVRSGHTAAGEAIAAIARSAQRVAHGHGVCGGDEISTALAPPEQDSGRGAGRRKGRGIVVLAPLSLEARAVRHGAPWADVRQIGMGPRRAARSAELSIAAGGSQATLIAGFCGALDPDLEPGDIDPRQRAARDRPARFRATIRRSSPACCGAAGLRVRIAPIASSQRLVLGERRRTLFRTGAVAVDMESAWLAPAVRQSPAGDAAGRARHQPPRAAPAAADGHRRGDRLPRVAPRVLAGRGVGRFARRS